MWRFHGWYKVAESACKNRQGADDPWEGVKVVCTGRQAGRQAVRTPGWHGEVSSMHGHDSQMKVRVTSALT